MSEAATTHARALLDLTYKLCADAEEAEAYLARRELLPSERMEEHTRLANLYRAEMTRVKANPALLQGADQTELDALIASGAQLRTLLDRRQRTLAALKTISEGLAEAMAQEAARQAAPPTAYGRQGELPAGGPQAVAVDRRA